MSLSTSDVTILSWLPIEYTIVLALIVLLLILLSSLKIVFGTYSLSSAINQYKTKKRLSETYHKLFQTRDNLLYHISYAKSHDEHAEAKRMIQELIQLDKVAFFYSFKDYCT